MTSPDGVDSTASLFQEGNDNALSPIAREPDGNETNGFDCLPCELGAFILSFLPYSDRKNLQQVNRRFRGWHHLAPPVTPELLDLPDQALQKIVEHMSEWEERLSLAQTNRRLRSIENATGPAIKREEIDDLQLIVEESDGVKIGAPGFTDNAMHVEEALIVLRTIVVTSEMHTLYINSASDIPLPASFLNLLPSFRCSMLDFADQGPEFRFERVLEAYRQQPFMKNVEIGYPRPVHSVTASQLIHLYQMSLGREKASVKLVLEVDWTVMQGFADSVMGISDCHHFSREAPLGPLHSTHATGKIVYGPGEDLQEHPLTLDYIDGRTVVFIDVRANGRYDIDWEHDCCDLMMEDLEVVRGWS